MLAPDRVQSEWRRPFLPSSPRPLGPMGGSPRDADTGDHPIIVLARRVAPSTAAFTSRKLQQQSWRVGQMSSLAANVDGSRRSHTGMKSALTATEDASVPQQWRPAHRGRPGCSNQVGGAPSGLCLRLRGGCGRGVDDEPAGLSVLDLADMQPRWPTRLLSRHAAPLVRLPHVRVFVGRAL